LRGEKWQRKKQQSKQKKVMRVLKLVGVDAVAAHPTINQQKAAQKIKCAVLEANSGPGCANQLTLREIKTNLGVWYYENRDFRLRVP